MKLSFIALLMEILIAIVEFYEELTPWCIVSKNYDSELKKV